MRIGSSDGYTINAGDYQQFILKRCACLEMNIYRNVIKNTEIRQNSGNDINCEFILTNFISCIAKQLIQLNFGLRYKSY